MLIIELLFMFKIHKDLTKSTKKIKFFIDFYAKKVYYVYCIGVFMVNFLI